jgi:GNAT superfamily N-acetyltransferase
MANEDIRIRLAAPNDGPAIRSLLAGVFPGNPKAEPEIMAWQYWDNPFGAPRAWVAETEGRVVAHYAGICLPGRIGGQRTTLALGVDAATDPAYRGLGLFEQLARAVYADAGAAGLSVTYCLPNPNSLRGFRKAGGQDLGRARVLVAPLDTGWLGERFHLPMPLARAARGLFRLGDGGEATVVTDLPADLDELWAAVAEDQGNGIERSRAWWEWRYAGRPGDAGYVLVESRRSGRLVGAAVARGRSDLGGPMLCLLEMLALDGDAARDLVGRLASSVAPLTAAVGIAATAMSGTPLFHLARRAGLRALPPRFEPQPMHVGLVDNLGALPGIAGQRWSLAWGDLDHI